MLLTVLTVAALKPIYLAFDSNFTTSGSDFDWRLTGIVSASASRLAGAQVFWSTTGQFSPNHISNDVFYGVNYYTLGAPPSGYLAFYDWAADVNVSDREWLSLDVSAAAGFVGHTVWLIEERTPNNTAARRYPLALALWKSDPVPWSPQADGVNATTFTGSGPGGSSIRITYIVASRRGTLNVQNSTSAIVVPKGIEFLVEVEGWPYASPDNHLAVHIGIGTANVQAQASGSIVTRLVHARNASIRPNDTEVYVAFVQNCVADGSLRPVGVEVLVNGSSDVVAWNSYLTTQLKFAYGGDASLADVVVSFPPNASYILYDPGAGAGTPPPVPEELNGNGDGSGKTAVILTITLVIVVAVIAAGVAWVMVHRRRDRYNAV